MNALVHEISSRDLHLEFSSDNQTIYDAIPMDDTTAPTDNISHYFHRRNDHEPKYDDVDNNTFIAVREEVIEEKYDTQQGPPPNIIQQPLPPQK